MAGSDWDNSRDNDGFMPGMECKVTVSTFHNVHDMASEAQRQFKEGKYLTKDDLRIILAKLQAGQSMSDAETGIDFMFAPRYNDDIRAVRAAIAKME